MPSRKYWPLLAFYLIVGLAAYWRILGTFFVADDFSYLDALEKTSSPSVIFSVLAGRYFRPAVVFVYYVNYHVSGLNAFTYHLSVVLIHVANAWLVFLLGRSLAPDRRVLVPAAAGFLFLVFGGHAEAVTWIGGMADPLLTLFLLLAMLCLRWSLDSTQPLRLLAGCWLAFAAALLSKESAAIFVGLAVVVAVLGSPTPFDWRRVRLLAIALAIPAVILAGYFLLRYRLLGFAFVNLEGLGTSVDPISTVRAFVLRAFLPIGTLLQLIWTRHLDLFILAPAALLLAWFARREDHRPLAFLAACLAIAIAPVLPLSISLATPESERLIYLPSAFACLLGVWLVAAGTRRPAIVVAVTAVGAVWHLRALDRTNRTWETAAALTRSQTASFGALMRERHQPGRTVFVVNVTDNIRGVFVWRRGFQEALRLTAPDQATAIARTVVLSVNQIEDTQTPASVTQSGPHTFQLRVASGFVAGGPSKTPLYELRDWSAAGFTADFTPAAGRGLIVYFTPERAALAGALDMTPAPFGYVDTPADGAQCGSNSVDVQGWALDDEGVSRVVVAVERNGVTAPAEIGTATMLDRPDVAAIFPNYPDSRRAGWSFALPCTALGGAAGRVHVIAENRLGERTTLGVRVIRR